MSEDHSLITELESNNFYCSTKYNENIIEITQIYSCEICNKTFNKMKNLNKHKKLHGTKTYKCDKCENCYSRSDHLRRHMTSHDDNKTPYACDKCIQQFSNKSHLNRHIKNIHGERKIVYKCEEKECEMSFDKKSKLSKHISQFHKAKTNFTNFECYYPFCGKIYNSQNKLNQHIENKHNLNILNNPLQEKKAKEFFQCPFEDCYKSYSIMFNLKVHIKTFHYELKEFACNECNQSFKHKCSLERHILRIHQNHSQKYLLESCNNLTEVDTKTN
jgi:uncharacterized Zn-finger protein